MQRVVAEGPEAQAAGWMAAVPVVGPGMMALMQAPGGPGQRGPDLCERDQRPKHRAPLTPLGTRQGLLLA